MLRILLSAYACAPNYGTEPGNGWNWALHLAERGMDVRVLAEEGARAAIEQFCREHPEYPVRFAFFPSAGPRFLHGHSGFRYLLWQWRAVAEARKLMRSERYDVVHHVTFGSVHVPTLLWRLGLPTVFGPVGGGNTAPKSMLAYLGQSRWKERFRTLTVRALRVSPYHRWSYGKIDALLGTNRETLELFGALGRPDAQLAFDSALPENFFAQGPRTWAETDAPLRILWVGRLLPRKALSLTLDALQHVRSPWTMTVLGSSDDPRTVRADLRARGMEDRVRWSGERAPWAEVRAAYGEHDVLLFNSLRESLGSQLLEAMAMGLPIICLDHQGARDFVPDGVGYKVPIGEPEQVARDLGAAVDCFAAMPAGEREAMSKRAWTFAHEHTWRKRAEFAEELYRKLVGSRRTERAEKRAGVSGPMRVVATGKTQGRAVRMDRTEEILLALREKLDGIAAVLKPRSRVIYIDYPLHRNIGDLLINQGTEEFFRRHRIVVKRRYNLHDLPDNLSGIASDDVFVFHGGGNFGDLYPEHLDAMVRVMRQFPHNQIVQMPQTVFFADDRQRAERCRLLREHENLTIFVRDTRSQRALEEYGVANVHLMPDMAHQLYGQLRPSPAEPVDENLYFFRRDPESAGSPPSEIARHSATAVDWDECMRRGDRLACALLSRFVIRSRRMGRPVDVHRLWYRVRDNLVRSGVGMLSRPRTIYTNRLHAMLLGLLLGREVRWFDNSYGKLSSYVETWLGEAASLQPVAEPALEELAG